MYEDQTVAAVPTFIVERNGCRPLNRKPEIEKRKQPRRSTCDLREIKCEPRNQQRRRPDRKEGACIIRRRNGVPGMRLDRLGANTGSPAAFGNPIATLF